MSIIVSAKNDIFLLSTRSTSYAFGIDDRGLVRHLYWGKKIPSAEELDMPQLTEVSTNDPVFEITPEEFPVHGGLRYKEHCLKAAFSDGTRELVYQYCGYDVEEGDGWARERRREHGAAAAWSARAEEVEKILRAIGLY